MKTHAPQDVLDQFYEAKQRLQEWDAQRDGIPGEHWAALGAGILLFMSTRRSPSVLLRIGSGVLASLLIVRAATGRDGLAQRRWLPL